MLQRVLITTLMIVAATASRAACVEHENPPSAAALEKAAVLEVMDHYLAAISSGNLEAMRQLQTPDGMTYRAKSSADGSVQVASHPNSWWVDPARKDGHALRERYWAPTVLVRGSIAVVWAPYEFWIDGKTSHCGIDSFNFVKVGASWLVANAMWTVEPDSCADLRPKSPAEFRPAE
jgi:hypothetical protein